MLRNCEYVFVTVIAMASVSATMAMMQVKMTTVGQTTPETVETRGREGVAGEVSCYLPSPFGQAGRSLKI